MPYYNAEMLVTKKESIPFYLKAVRQLSENSPWGSPPGQPHPANWSSSGHAGGLNNNPVTVMSFKLDKNIWQILVTQRVGTCPLVLIFKESAMRSKFVIVY
jgi:hypothetical protein